ncbi:MAG: sulfotransferase family 2 domain-containing protein [Trichodesmium sp. MAG_R03]|nr:sulfotransferase family 2 domain-containing protein [Trichodesmium sp. MAG_R03]
MNQKDAKQYIDEGYKLVREGYFEAAIGSYEKAIKLNPEVFPAYLEQGSLLVKLGEHEKGISILHKAVEKFPQNPVTYVYLGAALTKLGKKDLARDFFKKAIELDSTQALWVYYGASRQGFDILDIEKYKIAYCPIPKCASSTIKSVFYKLETRQDTINPHIHYNNPFFRTQQKSLKDYKNYYKFVVVRDPIKRFLSYYSKNIIHSQSLANHYGGKSFAFGLDCIPNINFFIEHLEDYIYTFIDVRHHTLCQSAYISDSLEDYDLICKIEDLDKLVIHLNKIIGFKINLPNLMHSQKNISNIFPELSLRSLEKLIEFYQKDYKLLKDYYLHDEIFREYKSWLLCQPSLMRNEATMK